MAARGFFGSNLFGGGFWGSRFWRPASGPAPTPIVGGAGSEEVYRWRKQQAAAAAARKKRRQQLEEEEIIAMELL